MDSKRLPITYTYDVEGHNVTVTRKWVREAYPRNGNAGNPTQYYVWASACDGEYVMGNCPTQSEAYEYARAQALGIEYSACRDYGNARMRNGVNVRNFRLVKDEMKANYKSRVKG